MAKEPTSLRHPHLVLAREQQSIERKKYGGGKTTPVDAPARKKTAQKLKTKLDEFRLEVEKVKPAVPGIKPHLVFKVPVQPGADTEKLAKLFEDAKMHVVSYEADGAIIVFRDDANLKEMMQFVAAFESGPRRDRKTNALNKGMREDVLHQIDFARMQRWQRADRLGKRLVERFGADFGKGDANAIAPVDIELWHPGSAPLAKSVIAEVEKVLGGKQSKVERLSDQYIGETTILLRVKATPATLNKLADLDVVAEMELPPVPVFDRLAAHKVRKSEFKITTTLPADAPSVCVVDSGITSGHPLIQPHVGAAKAILTKTATTADLAGHGTMVSGLAVFGDVRACYDNGEFTSPIRLHSARVLNDQNEFDDDDLVITQMRKAIEHFVAAPHNCRVFNVSIGTNSATLAESGGRQKPWAEAMDVLARRHKILIVVSAGNRTELFARSGADAEKTFKSYPELLFESENGLNEPATASIAITVGALAQTDAPAKDDGDRTVRAIAGVNEPAPYSRIGPGMSGAIKPEFVDYGGNAAFKGMLNLRKITGDDPGLAAMSLSREPTKHLFAFDVGTSFAAPRVAHKAARLWKELERQLGKTVHPNLVRAVMAVAASHPPETAARLGNGELDRLLRATGYGLIDLNIAAASSERRVTMVAQGDLTLDHFVVYSVPLPKEFLMATGQKYIDVALAFDPPVRSRRMDYLGVQMNFDLYREKDLNAVIEACRRVEKADSDEEDEDSDDDDGASMGKLKKIELLPKNRSKKPRLCQRYRSTLQRASWSGSKPQAAKYGDSLWLVVRALNNWITVPDDKQQFAVAVTLRAEEPRLYELLRARLQQRIQQRQRGHV